MKRIRTVAPRIRRERRRPEELPAGPPDPDVVRAKAVPSTAPAPVPVTADHSRPRPAGTTGTHDRAEPQMARPSRPPGQPTRAIVQAQHIFHELHADGRNALCAVCDSQYRLV